MERFCLRLNEGRQAVQKIAAKAALLFVMEHLSCRESYDEIPELLIWINLKKLTPWQVVGVNVDVFSS